MKRFLFALGLAAFLLVVFFHQRIGSNGMSRLLTVFALVENHSLRADPWAGLTPDQAIVDRHVYSDKAPLSSYLVVPFYALWRAGQRAPLTLSDRERANHLAMAVAAAAPFALFVVLLFLRLERTGAVSPALAVWVALAAAFGSLTFNYGNGYFGHVLAGTCLVLSYRLAIDDRAQGDDRAHALRLAWAGFFGGAAVLTEYPTALGVAGILFLLWLWPARRPLLLYLAGASPTAALFFVHNLAVTGSLFTLPYARVSDRWKEMQHGFGLGKPNWLIMWDLLFSQSRGVLFFAPILWLFLPRLLADSGEARARRLVLAAVGISYVVLISSYFRWEGGWCVGPRHLTPILMLFVYEGAATFGSPDRSKRDTWLFFALAALGIAVNLTFAATDALLPDAQRPFLDQAFPALRDGKVNPHNLATELFGVPAKRRLVSLWVALFLGSAAGLARLARKWRPLAIPPGERA